jgi:hypothetical protein
MNVLYSKVTQSHLQVQLPYSNAVKLLAHNVLQSIMFIVAENHCSKAPNQETFNSAVFLCGENLHIYKIYLLLIFSWLWPISC